MHKLIKNFAKSVPPIHRIIQERDELRKQVAGLQEQLSLWQASRQNAPGDLTLFENYGYCPCCDSNVKFVAYDSWWRDPARTSLHALY